MHADTHLSPVVFTAEEADIVRSVITATMQWSEIPLYDHEYTALTRVLAKLPEGRRS